IPFASKRARESIEKITRIVTAGGGTVTGTFSVASVGDMEVGNDIALKKTVASVPPPSAEVITGPRAAKSSTTAGTTVRPPAAVGRVPISTRFLITMLVLTLLLGGGIAVGVRRVRHDAATLPTSPDSPIVTVTVHSPQPPPPTTATATTTAVSTATSAS